jgi:DNA (cytosine-5)-methyltransferase 1
MQLFYVLIIIALNMTVRKMMSAYYNENDPYAAQWLRNLIAAGHIAPGDVDERSIVDVRSSDLDGYAQCHFFAGIGGWSLALRMSDWPDDRRVWTGSCPCQPLSSAGKRQGHADERHLWPDFCRLIAEQRPPVVFGEQVASKDGGEWLAGVHADLEGLGYAFGAADLPAACVGAPHKRQRLYWVANADSAGEYGWSALRQRDPNTRWITKRGGFLDVAD